MTSAASDTQIMQQGDLAIVVKPALVT